VTRARAQTLTVNGKIKKGKKEKKKTLELGQHLGIIA
jgi:hypothetical protein